MTYFKKLYTQTQSENYIFETFIVLNVMPRCTKVCQRSIQVPLQKFLEQKSVTHLPNLLLLGSMCI